MSASPFREGQVVTVFRSKLVDDPDPRYEELNDALQRRAHELGGFVELKSFTADDGERVTVVTFADRASHERWADDAAHRRAQSLGKSAIYAAYSIQVADCTRVSAFDVTDG